MRTTGWMTTKLVLAIATALAIAAPTVHAQMSFSTKQFGIAGGATTAAARGNIVIPEGTLSSRHLVPSESFRNQTGRLARADAEEGGSDKEGGSDNGGGGGNSGGGGGGVAGGGSGGGNTTTGNTASRDREGPSSDSGSSSGSSGSSSTPRDNVNTRGDGQH